MPALDMFAYDSRNQAFASLTSEFVHFGSGKHPAFLNVPHPGLDLSLKPLLIIGTLSGFLDITAHEVPNKLRSGTVIDAGCFGKGFFQVVVNSNGEG